MRAPATAANEPGISQHGKTLPRVITLGGDHTITLPLLRSMNRAYGPITVIHFDSHLDTWKPKVFGGAPSKIASVNHGTYFYHAAEEGLLRNDTNIHAGIRTTLSGLSDYDNDGYCGFHIVEAREIDTIGTEGIIKKIHERVGHKNPVYLSIDIDTLVSKECCNIARASQGAAQTYINPPSHSKSRHLLTRLPPGPSLRSRDWYSRDRRLVDQRASNHRSRTEGHPAGCCR